MHLSLLGMPGSGKTTLGRALAQHFNRPFLDLDAEVAARAGQSIPAVFAQHGEAYFRQLEAEALRAVVARPGPLVLATGGGTPCFHDNIKVLNNSSFTLWLDVPVAVLAHRLGKGGAAKRPLLAATGPGLAASLAETLAARRQFYAQARLRFAETRLPLEALLPALARAGFPASALV
ncbi:shikimate kinase [Hymenobacter caeli]|uniref:Shikimate kinase n=1 Tax=Hymenobacter caeli TaxID=2735894 RepID=A0ABX2FNX8_9BACT|nr:shikimate kinase [Hymenobacter caeli]NRT18558.1 shikimate kinase [Hymenobacter caeli]